MRFERITGVGIMLLVAGSRKELIAGKRFNHEEVAMENERNAHEKKLYAQIQEWSVDIVLLTIKTGMARADVKIEYYKAIEALERKQDEVRMKLQESRAAGDRSWIMDLKRGAKKVWPEVQVA